MYRGKNRQVGIKIGFAYRNKNSMWIRLTLFGIFPMIQAVMHIKEKLK